MQKVSNSLFRYGRAILRAYGWATFGQEALSFLRFGIALALVTSEANGQDLRISGNLSYRSFRANGDLFYTSEARFITRVAYPYSTNWSIRMEASEAPGPVSGPYVMFEYYEVASSGSNIFYIEKARPEAFSNLAGGSATTNLETKGDSSGRILTSARVSPGPVPASEPGYYVGPIWFAFASGSYLSTRRGSNELSAIWPVPNGALLSNRYVLRAEIRLADAAPCLPEQVLFFSRGKYPEAKPGGEMFRMRNYPKPYNEGFTNAIFEAAQFTNFHALLIPLRFELKQFGIRPSGASAQQLNLRAYWEGAVTSLEEVPVGSDYMPGPRTAGQTVRKRSP